MSKSLARIGGKQQRANQRKRATRALDNANPERGGPDMARAVGREKAELQRREKARKEFRQR